MHGNFINDQIFLDSIPRIEEVELQGLQPSYRYVLFMRSIFSTITLFLGFILFTSLFLKWSFLVLALGFGGLVIYGISSLVLNYLAFGKKGYAIREKDIIYKSGLLWKRQIVIPFSRIQHCQIKEGPIDSLLELARLDIYTAGGSGSDLVIPGLRPQEALELRNLIIKETALDEEE